MLKEGGKEMWERVREDVHVREGRWKMGVTGKEGAVGGGRGMTGFEGGVGGRRRKRWKMGVTG
jgi:hypothetical protein